MDFSVQSNAEFRRIDQLTLCIGQQRRQPKQSDTGSNLSNISAPHTTLEEPAATESASRHIQTASQQQASGNSSNSMQPVPTIQRPATRGSGPSLSQLDGQQQLNRDDSNIRQPTTGLVTPITPQASSDMSKADSHHQLNGNISNVPQPNPALNNPITPEAFSSHSQNAGTQQQMPDFGDSYMIDACQEEFLLLNDDYDKFVQPVNSSHMSSWSSTSAYVTANTGPAPIVSQSDRQHQPRPPQANGKASTLTALTSKDAISAGGTEQLPRGVQLTLIDTYFAHSHILYPIMSEQAFRASFASMAASPILLPAVLFVGAIHAPDLVIHRARFESREDCLGNLYDRAKKAFFEGDKDTDTLPSVQAAFLLHHMWSTQHVKMDPRTWLGLAVQLAQKMGMHCTTARSALKDTHQQKLWKRIWWLLSVSIMIY